MTALFRLNKRCKAVDKYDEVDEGGAVVDKDKALLGTVYVRKDIAQGRQTLKITVED